MNRLVTLRSKDEPRKQGTTLNLIGERFAHLTVIEFSHRTESRRYHWVCMCDCGRRTIVAAANLTSGNSKQCAQCAMAENLNTSTHGLSGTKEHRVWKALHGRCRSSNPITYTHYKARGITVCARWSSFENFLEDMGKCPSPKHEIDRIDNNGNYDASNCRWATRTQNTRNRSVSKRWVVNGIEHESLAVAASANRVSIQTICNWCEGGRLKAGGKTAPRPNCKSFRPYENITI